MTETHIRWQSSGIAFYGDVGTFNGRAFTIWRPGSMRSDDVGRLVTDLDEGVLVTQLPGMEDERYCSKDEKELKAEAERWLTRFVSSLGAVFPDPEPPECRCTLSVECPDCRASRESAPRVAGTEE